MTLTKLTGTELHVTFCPGQIEEEENFCFQFLKKILNSFLSISEFIKLWDCLSNYPAFETDLLILAVRMASQTVGTFDWSPYLDRFFTRIMKSFGLPVTYYDQPSDAEHGLSDSKGTYSASEADFIVSAMWGGRGLVLK